MSVLWIETGGKGEVDSAKTTIRGIDSMHGVDSLVLDVLGGSLIRSEERVNEIA